MGWAPLKKKYIGHCAPKNELPIGPGMQVRIPKGTLVLSLHPQKDGWTPSGTSRTITVHHLYEGTSCRIGTMDEGEFVSQAYWKDQEQRCRKYGIKTHPPYDQEAYAKLLDLPRCETRGDEVWFHDHDPMVVWPGAGGYWCQASINDIQVQEP